MTQRPSHSRRSVVLPVLLAAGLGLTVTACGQRRHQPSTPNIDAETQARLGLTEDARDPTVREREAGYGPWKARPEPTGTHDPLSPERRKFGGPDW